MFSVKFHGSIFVLFFSVDWCCSLNNKNTLWTPPIIYPGFFFSCINNSLNHRTAQHGGILWHSANIPSLSAGTLQFSWEHTGKKSHYSRNLSVEENCVCILSFSCVSNNSFCDGSGRNSRGMADSYRLSVNTPDPPEMKFNHHKKTVKKSFALGEIYQTLLIMFAKSGCTAVNGEDKANPSR